MKILEADYLNSSHAADLVSLLDQYARHEMGGGKPLPESIKANLPNALADLPNAFSLIAYVDGQPAGLANCFWGFSTFNCKKLINIHDLSVAAEFRGQGVGSKLLAAVEAKAIAAGCCKITLEVLDSNTVARSVYEKFGFGNYQLVDDQTSTLFLEKKLF